MNRSLLAAPAIAALLLAGVTGIASADDEARSCEIVKSELLDAEAAASLPVTIDGATFTSLPGLEDYRDRLSDVPAAQEGVAAAQAVLDAAGRVSVLQQEQATCTDEPAPEPEPTTETPAPTDEQSPTDRPEEGVIPLYADCAEARDFGAAPIAEGDPGYRAGLDSDSDGTACEIDDPGSLGNATGGSDDTLGGSDDSNSGVVDSIPSGSVDTGFVA